jgi:hypothetical protein
VDTVVASATDIHAGAFTDGLEPLEHLDLRRIIRCSRFLFSHFPSLNTIYNRHIIPGKLYSSNYHEIYCIVYIYYANVSLKE